jgi:hypothetical protein
MAKSDLLKQAIADAKAVKETALANAKLALQEAFAPRLESMLQAQLQEELEDEEMEDGAEEMEMGAEDMEAGAEEMGDYPTSVNVGLDFNDDGDYDLTGMLGGEEEMEAGEEEMEMGAEDMEAGAEEDDLNLEEILEELEADSAEHSLETEGMYEGDEEDPFANSTVPNSKELGETDRHLEEIIEAILSEEEAMPLYPEKDGVPGATVREMENLETENEKMKNELEEAYRTVKHLKSVINEVNLLNAKLLYTNKLFRNFDLNEGQKMKVIENFDRAVSTREAKLVFATLAESFNKPTQKRRMVKESAASRPATTTAPSKQTTQILSEGFEMANRWKKLAGLI